MARRPSLVSTAGISVTDVDTPNLSLMVNAANMMATVQNNYSDERDVLNQLLGQVQIADVFAKFSVTVTTTKLSFIKENKLYRALQGRKNGNGHLLAGTWEEFCLLLGRSREQIDEDIRNLKALGENAVESMQRMGIGYRTLRQFRKLPDDQKATLLEIAERGDKESLIEFAEELLLQHAREKNSLMLRLDETQATLDARSDVLKNKNQYIDQLTEKMAKLEKHVQTMPVADVGEQLRLETSRTASHAEVGIRALRPGLIALAQHTEQHGIFHHEYSAGLLGQLGRAIEELCSEFGIKSTFNSEHIPVWIHEVIPSNQHHESNSQ